MPNDYKVLITTSGTGSRLKDLTKHTNKSLIEINKKAIISYIIDAYPPDIEIVVTLGFKGKKVKEFLEIKYPGRKFIFVTISHFEGEGSSLAYSMLQTKTYLDCSFIFHCNDTIVEGPIPAPLDYNWNGGSLGNDPKLFNTHHYGSYKVKDGWLEKIQPKGADSFDYFHIGIVGIKDYATFWIELEKAHLANPSDQTLNDVVAINTMLENEIDFKSVVFTNWLDTGNLAALENAKRSLEKSKS